MRTIINKSITSIISIIVLTLSLSLSAIENRVITITGQIDNAMGLRVISQIEDFNKSSDVLPIRIVIDSPGGSVDIGIYMVRAMQDSKAPIYTYATKKACSMAAIILCMGKPGHRYAKKDSLIMIHDITITLEDKFPGAESYMKSMSKIRLELLRDMADATNKPVVTIETDLQIDRFMTAEQAKEYRLIDNVY